jgi:ParB-like chromosome segregation protein Spo0J
MPVAVTIPLHLIDEPEVAMRSDISDDYLRDLADNITATDCINPISVTRNGERYTIAAGHCRYPCAQATRA